MSRHSAQGAASNQPSSRVAGKRNSGRRAQNSGQGALVRTIILLVVALAAGFGLGALVFSRTPLPEAPHVAMGKSSALAGKCTVTADELDAVLGTYDYNGSTTNVTVRQAIEESSSLEAVQNEDGTYELPSSDAVLSIARNNILLQEAAARNVLATEDEALAYARDTLGTDDYATIASSYHMSADKVKEQMQSAATIRKLKESVVATKPGAQPQPPESPEEGKEDEPSEEYAAYVIGLLGDEWDSNANTWARDNGAFREALTDYTISNDAATCSAAQAAYYVAYTQYAATEQQVSKEWTTFVNELLSQATVQLSSLVA
ncbi:MAG: hypothetical protein Q4A01_10295 [Coriobacteriales bacterium]|nr:hypothetical protein [Coriobacteriales bacterium]